jgi:hypothetical protein
MRQYSVHLEGCVHIHRPPTTRGMKYHVFLLKTWTKWSMVVRANATRNIIAAVRDG